MEAKYDRMVCCSLLAHANLVSAAAAEGDADGRGAKFLEGLDDLLDSPNFWRHVQSKSPQVSAIQILGF